MYSFEMHEFHTIICLDVSALQQLETALCVYMEQL